MGIVHMNGPADPHGKCPFCLMHAKQVQWSMYQADAEAAWRAPGDEVRYFPWPPALDKEVLEGRYRAVPGDAPHLGIMDGLCWDHVAGIAGQQASGLAVARQPLPPGLMKGKR